jgi:hypothetical protein
LLSDERKRFIEAVDSVNPNRWKREVAPSEGDIDAVTAYAWFLAFVFAPALQESGLFPANGGLAIGLSLLTGVIALLAGGALFDRASSAIDSDSTWKDVLSPRDSAFKAFSVFALLAIASGIVWICIAADGWVGVAEAALLIGIIAGVCWASSYIDLMLRGIAYLGAVAWSAIVWLLRMIIRLAWLSILLVAAAVVATILFILHVIAWPVTWLKSQFNKEPTANELKANAA